MVEGCGGDDDFNGSRCVSGGWGRSSVGGVRLDNDGGEGVTSFIFLLFGRVICFNLFLGLKVFHDHNFISICITNIELLKDNLKVNSLIVNE